MRVAVPKETTNNEFRVALTPAGVHELVERGHDVMVQHDAGAGSAIPDADFKAAGAQVVDDPAEVWGAADLLLKVKEPLPSEYGYLRPDLTLFTYLHLAASRPCTDALLAAGTTAIAYETVRTADGRLPLLAPMSEVAGRLAPQAGAYHLMAGRGGRGVLMGGVPGTPGADVVVLGAGVAGANAAAVAVGMGAHVSVLDIDVDKLRALDERHTGLRTVYSTTLAVREAVEHADLVIGAVLVPGAKTPTLVPNGLVARMRQGAVLVDVAIDQGGCFADSRPTTHDEPTYAVHDTIFYCVANMPGAVPHTATRALTNATTPYVLRLADAGWRDALASGPSLARGLNTHGGELFSAEVAAAHGLAHSRVDAMIRTGAE